MQLLKESKIVHTVNAAREAISLRIQAFEKGYDGYRLDPLEKWFLALRTLNPMELKKWIHCASSYNYGWHIFDQTFPVYENPEPFHSTPLMVDLTDDPVQVLGWKEVDELIEEGVQQGLLKRWIELGFNMRSEERGIDLEWHFFATSRQRVESFPYLDNGDGTR